MEIGSMKSDELRISKSVLPSLPEGYEETRLGDPRGSRRQFRGRSGIHVREYPDEYVIHVDRVDPRRDPFGHLVRDSPETLVSVVAGLLAAGKVGNSGHPLRERKATDSRTGVLAFFLVFLTANGLARFLKRLFLG